MTAILLFNLLMALFGSYKILGSSKIVWQIGLKFKMMTMHYFLAKDKAEYKLAIKTMLIIEFIFCMVLMGAVIQKIVNNFEPYKSATSAGWNMLIYFFYAVRVQWQYMLLNNSDFSLLSKLFKTKTEDHG